MSVLVTKCAACSSPLRLDINTRLASGQGAKAVSEWLTSAGHPISRNGLQNHKTNHLNPDVQQAVADIKKDNDVLPASIDFAQAVRDKAHQRLVAGLIQPDIKDGLSAQSILDRRSESTHNREFIFQLAQLLGGGSAGLLGDGVVEGDYRVLDDERDGDERRLRELASGSNPRDGLVALDAPAGSPRGTS